MERSPGSGRSLGEGKGYPLCSILAWRIPWTEEPGGLQSMWLQRTGHDWETNTFTLSMEVYFHEGISVRIWGKSRWNSLAQNTGVGSLSLFQGIFPAQGLNPGLLHCGQVLYQLSHKRSLWHNAIIKIWKNMREINKKWRQETKPFLSDSITHGLWFIVWISDCPGGKWYVVKKTEDLPCLTLHVPVLRIHGPLKHRKENVSCHCSIMSDSLWPLWTVAYQAPPSMGFSRQGYWSGLPFHSPGDLPDPGIEPESPTLQADALPSKLPGKPPRKTLDLLKYQIKCRLVCTSQIFSCRYGINYLSREKNGRDVLIWLPGP